MGNSAPLSFGDVVDKDNKPYPEEIRSREFRELLRDVPGLVIDVGCGPTSPLARSRDGNVLSLDIAAKAIRYLKDRLPCDDYIVADASHLPLRDGSGDIVIAPYLIDAADWEKVAPIISEMLRISKTKSVLVEISRDWNPNGISAFDIKDIAGEAGAFSFQTDRETHSIFVGVAKNKVTDLPAWLGRLFGANFIVARNSLGSDRQEQLSRI